jgi:hypothetical protein
MRSITPFEALHVHDGPMGVLDLPHKPADPLAHRKERFRFHTDIREPDLTRIGSFPQVI